MRKIMFVTATGVVLLLIGSAVGALALVTGMFNNSMDELREEFERPASRFIDIDGVDTHYIDEGDGPVIVLLHGNIGSLAMWDDWASELVPEFRVIRPDFTAHGLTSADPAVAGPGEYVDRGIARLEALLEALDVEQYAVVGTSFSGITAFRLAARRPDTVTALMLINSGGLPRTAQTDPNRQRDNALLWWVYGYYYPKWRIVETLEALTAEAFRVEPSLVNEYYKLQNLRGRQQEQRLGAGSYRPGDVFAILASIRQPVTLVWGGENAVLPTEQADAFVDSLINADVELVIYENAGHLLPIEKPQRGVEDLRRLLERAGYSPT